MIEEVGRIKKIQNSQNSLRWGSHPCSETEVLLSLGHVAYKGKVKYLIVNTDYEVYELLKDNSRVFICSGSDTTSAIEGLLPKLKEWFPTTHKVQMFRGKVK